MALKADITIDIDKQVGNLQNLTNIYNARVGDNNTPLTVLWQKNGIALNLKGLHAFIAGKVGDGSYNSETDKVDFPVGTPVVKYEDDGSGTLDNGQSGLTTLLIPKQMWAKTGLFAGYIGLKDENGSVFTSKDIFFKVLGNVLDAGVAINYFIGDFDEALAKAEKELEDKSANFDQTTAEALQDLHDKYLAEAQKAEDTLGDTQAAIDANIASLKRIAATCGSIQAQIDANDIVKLSDFKDQTNALANGQKNLTSTITSKLATLSAQPELFNSSSDIKAKYPNGSIGVKIATDTWHGWGYINDSWKDLGDYKPTSVPPIQLANASTAYLDEGNQISFRKLSDGNTAFKLPKGVNIIGHSVAVKLDDIKAAAVSSSNVKYEDGEFVGNTFLCIYHPSTKTVSFESSYANTNPEDLILFGVMWNSWIGGVLIQDSYNDRVENSARPWYGYLYGRTPLLEFSEDSGKSVTLSLDFNITIYGNQNHIDLTKEKITSDIKEQLKTAPVEGITYDEKDFKLSSDEFSLIYDFADQKVKIAHSGLPTLTSQQVNIFSQYFGNDFAGIAYEDYFKRKRTIPEYWQTELNQKIAEIQKNVGETKDGLSFLWITDIHWENNDGLSPMLIKQLVSRTNISYMIDGGDHFNSGSTIEEAINKLSEGYSNLTIPGIDHIGVVGNHDDNKMLWPRDPAKVLQNYQIFNAMFPHTLHSVDLKMTNYPVDLSWELKFNQNPELINHKYQYAAFGFDGRLEASKDQILKFVEFCKNPYKILAFTHGILDYGNWLQWGTDLGKIIDAINNKDTNVSTESYGVIDLKGVQAKVIALISGHEHQDNVKYTAGGTPLIVTDSDCGIQTYNNTKYPYKKRTITEQSFSVFSIDLDNSKIYEVKVGRGEDREFNIPEICKDDPQPTTPQAQPTEPKQ